MNMAYEELTKRMVAHFILVKKEDGDDLFVNTEMIVNVVEMEKNGGCILNLYGGELEKEGVPFYKLFNISTKLNEVHERIDNVGAKNFVKIKGIPAIFNTDYSFHFDTDNYAVPVGMRLSVPGRKSEILGEIDLVKMPPLQAKSDDHHLLADSAKSIYWLHVNLILGLVSEGHSSNYWHVCLVGGKSLRVRGPVRNLFALHPRLHDIPLVSVKDGIFLNLNHIHYFNSGENILYLCDKLQIENPQAEGADHKVKPLYVEDRFKIEKADTKKAVKDFLHEGLKPEIHFCSKK